MSSLHIISIKTVILHLGGNPLNIGHLLCNKKSFLYWKMIINIYVFSQKQQYCIIELITNKSISWIIQYCYVWLPMYIFIIIFQFYNTTGYPLQNKIVSCIFSVENYRFLKSPICSHPPFKIYVNLIPQKWRTPPFVIFPPLFLPCCHFSCCFWNKKSSLHD
jgi:hypothetical protein